MFVRSLLILAMVSIFGASFAQSVNDAIDDPIDCSTGASVAGILPGLIDIISIDIRKQNDDLVATIEFRGDPSIGDSVSGGIVAQDPTQLPISGGSDWHFDNVGNVMFAFSGDALSTRSTKLIADSLGAWVEDTTSAFSATRAGNVVIVRIPGQELGAGTLWMAYASSILFEVTPRCDAAGNSNHGLPTLEVPQLVAAADAFEAVGNVSVSVDAASGLLSNDVDALNVIDFDETSNGGGLVSIEPDGAFIFSPAPGFLGPDTFSYLVTDGKGGTAEATVTVDVGPAVWFVDADSPSEPGDGTLEAPFRDLASLTAILDLPEGPKALDAILILGDGAYSSDLVLKRGQIVIGQGVDPLLALQELEFPIPQYSTLLEISAPAGTPPTLASDSTNAITLSHDNTIRGLTVGDTPFGYGMQGDSVGSLNVSSVTIGGKGGILDLQKGTVNLALQSATSDSSIAHGMRLDEIAGAITIADSMVIRAPRLDGLRSRGSVSIGIEALHVLSADSGWAVFATEGSGGLFDVGSLEIRTRSGGGLHVDGADLHVAGGNVRSGGTALEAANADVDVVLDSLESVSGGGLRLEQATGRIVIGAGTVENGLAPGLSVYGSAVEARIGVLNIFGADTSSAVVVDQSGGTILHVDTLRASSSTGGGVLVAGADSLHIGAGFVVARGRSALDISGVAARVTLDSVAAAETGPGLRLVDVGGIFTISGTERPGSGGLFEDITGRAVEMRNVSEVHLSHIDISNAASDGVRLSNFGTATLSGLRIVDADSVGIRALAGANLEARQNVIELTYTGIELHEVESAVLAENSISATDSTAIVVSNAYGPVLPVLGGKRSAGDVAATVVRNEILTAAAHGVEVSADESGSVVLDLQDNKSVASEYDYVLESVDPGAIRLAGFAGGDAERAIEYVRRTNSGLPRVLIQGNVFAGPNGQADLAVEKTVSDPTPLPERMVEFRIVATNRGPSPAIQVVVSDSLPDGLAYVPASATLDGVLLTDDDDDDAIDFGWTREGTLTARLGDMSIGDTTVVTLLARPTQSHAGLSITNAATAAAMSPDSAATDNTASVRIDVVLNTGFEDGEHPYSFTLEGNYPNPFNPETTIGFELAKRIHVRLTVLNILGQPVAHLVDETLDAGLHTIRWRPDQTAHLPSGVYFYRLDAGEFRATRSMVLLK